ncbi:MAG: hypothetical protein JSV86_04920 [Gemmatimonadota bacterium]|nr:MAG: hypothetical protein JSV86_04920 [Gemmatimonadota bacterium]
MSAIQTLPFDLEDSPAAAQSNYDEIVGRTYLSPQSGQGIYRLVKWTGATTAAGDLAGKALVGTGGSYEATAVAGANAAANTLLGVAHPSLVGIVEQNDVILVGCEGQVEANADAPFGTGDILVGAAVGTDANGDQDAAATTTIGQVVKDQGGVDTVRFPNAVRIELDAKLYVPGV